MSDYHSTTESIFSIPDDMGADEKEDMIASSLTRIRATVRIINASVQGQIDVTIADFSSCLWGLEGQLEQLEKLVKFKVKENSNERT